MSPPSRSSYEIEAPESGAATPWSIEPTIRVPSEEALANTEEKAVVPPTDEEKRDAEGSRIVDDNPPPEGGRGWWVLLGSFLLTFSTFGLVNSWGIFQSLYEEVVLPTTNPSAIAWIGSIQYALCLMPGLLAGRLFDLGYLHIPLAAASTVLSLATILVAECKVYWHFLLVQGLITGMANGFVFGPAMPIVSHWFRKRRSTGIGIVAAGAAVGGTVLPIVVRQLIPAVGRKWTMRILGLIILVFQGVANLLVTRRLPSTNHPGGLTNPRAFRSIPYTLYVLGAFIGFLGMYTPLTFLSVSGTIQAGLPRSQAFYLVSIANASSLIGRVGGGLCSDKLGVVNVLVGANAAAAVGIFVWPAVGSWGGLVGIAVFYGAASGALVGLLAAPVAHLGDTADIGRRTGMMFTIVSIGSLIGPPISGAIYAATTGFKEVGTYAGCTVVLSAAILMGVKIAAVGTWKGKF